MRSVTAGGTGNGAPQNPYAFHAGIKDPGSGLVKFGLRWYNPVTGTWTQQDTLDSPVDPANANRYAYAGDDPINGTAPGLVDS
nr:RHS repeat-associated core domain-containing protein [Glaciihabitans sp. INWT7]